MKNLVKLLFIIFCFFTSLCVNVQGVQLTDTNSFGYIDAPPIEELSVKFNGYESSIVASNTHSCELSALTDRRDVFSNGSLDRASAQNKFLQQILSSNYNQLYFCISHNISSYLKNEICTRAP